MVKQIIAFFLISLFANQLVKSQTFTHEYVTILQLGYSKKSYTGTDFYVLTPRGDIYTIEYLEKNSLNCLDGFSTETKNKLIDCINFESLINVKFLFDSLPFIHKTFSKDPEIDFFYKVIKCRLTYIPSCSNSSKWTTILKCILKEPSEILPIGIDPDSIVISKKSRVKKKILKSAVCCINIKIQESSSKKID